MPERIPVFEPEVEELLLEVAANPDSLLLRGPQRGGVTGPLDLEEGVSARTAGLTVSEKQLLRVWRSEAAEVLRQGFNQCLEGDPEKPIRVVPLSLDNVQVRHTTSQELKAEVKRLSRVTQAVHPESPLVQTLHRLALGDAPNVRMRRPLIELSHRLRPTDKSRIGLALLEAQEGRSARAHAMYQSIATRSVSSESRAYALCNSVRLFAESGESNQRLSTAIAATRVAPAWAFSRLKCLRTAMDLGITQVAKDELGRLMDLGRPAQRMLEDHLEWLGSRIQRGLMAPEATLARTARKLSETGVGQSLVPLLKLAGQE